MSSCRSFEKSACFHKSQTVLRSKKKAQIFFKRLQHAAAAVAAAVLEMQKDSAKSSNYSACTQHLCVCMKVIVQCETAGGERTFILVMHV